MTLVSAISYALCAFAFGALALWLMSSWRGRFVGAVLVAATLLTAIWAGMVAYAAVGSAFAIAVETLELFRSGVWVLFVALLLIPLRHRSPWLRALLVAATVFVISALVVVPLVRITTGTGLALYPASVHAVFVMASIGMALFGLVLLEQLYRNLSQERRWALKFLCLAVGSIFAYDLYLYSHALLFQQMSIAAWDARGLINALAAPLVLIAARRNDDWSLSVYVSRNAAFHTAVMVAAGIYLVVVSLGGYYVRDFGGTWGEFAQILIFSMAAVALLAFLTSEVLRRRLNVLINKHFFSRKYDYRLEWLRLTHRLADATDGLDPYQRALAAVAGVVDSRGGALWRKRGDSFELAGQWNISLAGIGQIPGDAALVRFLEETGWITDLAEYRASPERYRNMELPAAVTDVTGAWAIVPLFRQQELRGFMLLTRPKSEPEINWEDRDVLKAIGLQVESYLSQHEDALALSQAQQFEAFNQLTAFLMHDLKNLIAQQSLIVKNAEKYKHNPEFVDDAFDTIRSSVSRMERLLGHLQRREHSGVTEWIDIQQLLEDAVKRCSDREPRPTLDAAVEGLMLAAERETVSMVLVHVIRNAQDATEPRGTVHMSAKEEGSNAVIDVLDTGAGMSPEFIRDKLFKPFTTTKRAKGMGIGAHQVREFVRQAGGRVDVWSTLGEGTRFRITLPASRHRAESEVEQGVV